MSEGEKKEAAPPVEATAKKPYSPPKLRHLGSVRELTLGATAGLDDGSLGKFQRP